MSKVELISKTVGLGSYSELNNRDVILAIARHGEIKEGKSRLITYLMNHKHWSPLQHVSFGFKIETRRSISAQIFRHRSLNGQEWSLRYSEPVGFEEIDIRREHPTNRQSSTESFDPIIDCTLDILPLCTKTTIHITGTLRDLLGFLNVRCDEHSQKEVRDIATAIGEELEKDLPDVFKAIDWRNGMFM